MPRYKQWVGFRDLCARHGEVVYLDLLGRPMLIIGSERAAAALLEKRSANTSDRPPSYLLPLIGNDLAFIVMAYGIRWRDHRRAFWQVFRPGAVGDYRNAERTFTHELLVGLLKAPLDFERHLRRMFSATNLKVLYGLEVHEDGNDEFIEKVQEALHCTSDLATRTHPVDYLPFLRHIPGWVPGAGWQYVLASCKAAVIHLKEMPFAKMKEAYDKGISQPCALDALLARMHRTAGSGTDDYAYQEDIIKGVGLAAFEAGSDTMLSTVLGLFLAMSLNPEVQRKVHAELDRVVGPHRLPEFEDREELVYINALIMEALRWHNVLPLGLPHRTVEDDVYEGRFIPAGTIIIANTWAMLHDPEVYDSPEEFRPERFIRDEVIDTDVRNPYTFAFGFGRRVCPGRYFADESLYIVIASVLHVFKFEPPLDEQGQPIKLELEQSHGLISYPEDLRCVLKPRSAEAAGLVANLKGPVEERRSGGDW